MFFHILSYISISYPIISHPFQKKTIKGPNCPVAKTVDLQKMLSRKRLTIRKQRNFPPFSRLPEATIVQCTLSRTNIAQTGCCVGVVPIFTKVWSLVDEGLMNKATSILYRNHWFFTLKKLAKTTGFCYFLRSKINGKTQLFSQKVEKPYVFNTFFRGTKKNSFLAFLLAKNYFVACFVCRI